MSFVSVVPIIVPLCSIYLWCNQNVFKRILQWINTIYSGRFNISTTNCSLGIFAKSLDGLPRAWVRIPPTPPTMAIGSRRNPRAFLLLEFCFLRNVTAVYPAQGLPPQPAPPTMAIGSQRNLRAFLLLEFVSHFSLCGLYVLPCLPILEAQRLQQ